MSNSKASSFSRNHKCPACQKPFTPDPQGTEGTTSSFPFCSRRCQLTDLGAWLEGRYKIVSDPTVQQAETDRLPNTHTASLDLANDNKIS